MHIFVSKCIFFVFTCVHRITPAVMWWWEMHYRNNLLLSPLFFIVNNIPADFFPCLRPRALVISRHVKCIILYINTKIYSFIYFYNPLSSLLSFFTVCTSFILSVLIVRIVLSPTPNFYFFVLFCFVFFVTPYFSLICYRDTSIPRL